MTSAHHSEKHAEKHTESESELSEAKLVESRHASGERNGLGIIASVLIGALLVSASVFWNTKLLIKKLGPQVAANQNLPAGQDGQQPAPQAQADDKPVDIQLKPDVPFLGNKDAKVTVVEYADFQCPFCGRWYSSAFSELKSKYIDTGKIKFVYQDFSFLGPESNAAAEAAKCAQEQGKFWQYHDYLYTHQNGENQGAFSVDNQKKFAKSLGLNTTQFNQCLDSHKYAQAVQDETSAGRKYGVSGTPTVFVNGKKIVGAQPASAFTQIIEEGLK